MNHLEFIFDEPGEIKAHTHENNSHSEQILFNQYERLNRNCKKLYDALKSGGWWSGKRIIAELDMLEYRRRIKDLKEAGIKIKEMSLSNGCKSWSL